MAFGEEMIIVRKSETEGKMVERNERLPTRTGQGPLPTPAQYNMYYVVSLSCFTLTIKDIAPFI